MKALAYGRRAEDDILGIVEYLVESSARAGERFLDDLDETLSRIRLFPGYGRLRPDLRVPGLRSVPLRDWVVYYVDRPNVVELVRVLSARQDLTLVSFNGFPN
ncbi:MAG: type II toxin-antitoxin system RelE/ParE family toxin [Dehalococcoidia bacterium]|nr:type II toxin-antitoxin system RelE/ParE family toxin [Dehalococcoidia bacterium]